MEREIFKKASKDIISKTYVRNKLALDVHCETIRLELRKSNNFKFCKAAVAPMLTTKHLLLTGQRNMFDFLMKNGMK